MIDRGRRKSEERRKGNKKKENHKGTMNLGKQPCPLPSLPALDLNLLGKGYQDGQCKQL